MKKFSVFFAVALMSQPVFSQQKILCEGTVTSLENPKLSYLEQRFRTLDAQGKRLQDSVVYTQSNGKAWGVKVLKYPQEGYLPEFRLEQKHVDRVVSASRQGSQWLIQQKIQKKNKSEKLQIPADAVMDAGIDVWIVERLAQLNQGKVIPFKLFAPEFGDWFRFQAAKVGTPGPNQVRIKLSAQSVVLKILGSPILVDYDLKTGQLLRYQGISDIRGPDDENIEGRVQYTCRKL